ncbi:MAG: hypothetical protein OEV06_05255 [Anaerolineae bacterium]|nr:hypothetical protein [Anaerolineae bacterium]
MNYISALATLISIVFAAAVFSRYLRRRGAHLLYWAIGAFIYFLGSLSEAALSVTYDPNLLKLYYLSGAMLTAAWLGQGTIFLLVRKGRLASASAAVLIAVSALAVYLIVSAPITSAPYDVSLPISGQYEAILTRSGFVVALTIILNIYGTIGLVGGAIYSAFLFWRKQILAHRMYGNILIAFGALLSASGGTLVLFGSIDWHSLALLLGVVFMFAGYLQAVAVPADSPQPG